MVSVVLGRLVGGRLLQAGQPKGDRRGADAHAVTVVQGGLVDELVVEVGAVAACEIDESPRAIVVALEAAMLPRRLIVGDAQGIPRRPPDGDGRLLGLHLARMLGRLDRQADHDSLLWRLPRPL